MLVAILALKTCLEKCGFPSLKSTEIISLTNGILSFALTLGTKSLTI